MKQHKLSLLAKAVVLACCTSAAHAAEESPFFEPLAVATEQTLGHGHSAQWTLPDVATQYQPSNITAEMQAALQSQQEGRFLDALIQLDDARKNAHAETVAEIDLLRASFLLQGSQPGEVLDILSGLERGAHAADAAALKAMAHLQLGRLQEALASAQQARLAGEGMLPNLAHSYALQGAGRVGEAREIIREHNRRAPQAITLAREAELALALGEASPAMALAQRAYAMDAAHPYVVAVNGLASLIGGRPGEAKAAFETALRRVPHDAKALFGFGLAEIRLGNVEAGKKKLQEAHEADPGNALILTYLGRAQWQDGQAEQAVESWRRARQADPMDPVPWLYQAQAELQANRPQQAQASLREAQARTANRSVYRGESLLKEDEQQLQANLAEVQRRLGLEELAFHTLADPAGEKSAATLRNQADLLQGRRFGESARRSLLLQSLFSEQPGSLPSSQDIYGDGSWETGASVPQHGVVSELGAQHASFNNYDELFAQRTALAANITAAGQDTRDGQVRLGAGNDTLGLGLAQRQFKTGGSGRFNHLDNRIAQAIVQWRPLSSTQAFLSHQTFDSQHEEVMFPGDPGNAAQPLSAKDNSRITRVGLRHSLTGGSELRALWSRQQTDQLVDYLDFVTGASLGTNPANSSAQGAELQYRASGEGYATQWGMQRTRGQILMPLYGTDFTKTTRQLYAAWQQALGQWQFEAQLGWGEMEYRDNTGAGNGTYLKRWLPGLGLVYAPGEATRLRFAAWRGMAMSHLGDASLAPASLAGILLNRPGDNGANGTLVDGVALGADQRLGAAWLLEGQAQRRKTEMPIPPLVAQVLRSWQVDDARLALHWQPENRPWAASLSYDQERFQAPPFGSQMALDSLQEQRLNAQQLELRWFAGEKCTAKLAWSYNRVDGTLQTNWSTSLLPYRDNFGMVDATLDWQLARPLSLVAGVRNATDRRFQYTNLDPLTPRFSSGRLAYARLQWVW